jgi:hypothetical protein
MTEEFTREDKYQNDLSQKEQPPSEFKVKISVLANPPNVQFITKL